MIKKFSITTNMKNMTKKTTGLTLVELMVTLGVIAILVAIGLPRLTGMSSGNRMSATINTLAADLATARSEAINRNRAVIVTQKAGGWTNGWTVDAPAAVGLAAVTLIDRPQVPNGMTLLELNGIANVAYGSDGLNSSGLQRQFTLCEPGKNGRIINVDISGRYATTQGGLCP